MRATSLLTENDDDLLRAIKNAGTSVSEVGAHRIEVVTITRNRMCLHPVHLAEGKAIARSLGLNLPLDHRMFVPGNTLWTGEHDGLEIQVRSVLRQVVTR